MDLGTSSTQLIATAFTFGLSALAFAYLPFIFVLVNGLVRANGGHNAHSSSILSIFIFAFAVHFLSCIFFMMGIKMLDILGALYQNNYLQDKIFPIFWARGEANVFSLANASGSIEDKGAYLQLYIVQTISDWLELAGVWVVFFSLCVCNNSDQKRCDAIQCCEFSCMAYYCEYCWVFRVFSVGKNCNFSTFYSRF